MAEKDIDGFRFSDSADVSIVEEEIARIKYLSEKMNMSNPEGVWALYDKLVQSGIFVTPIGYEYLRSLQSYLYKCPEIPDEQIRPIPVAISYSNALNKRKKDRDDRIEKTNEKRTFRKTFKNEYKISLVANVILVALVFAMFVITLKADNPNMINYRTAIENQYAQWEESLTEREKKVREKEKELGIQVAPSNNNELPAVQSDNSQNE